VTFGSLFAGIGGFDLGLERAGLTCKWQVEIDPFCQRVLEKHWPHVQRFDDVRECCAGRLRRSRDDQRCAECGRRDCLPWVDVLCGGFPCQDISVAGKGAGLAGERSGLWSEYARLIGELRPRYVVVENVPALLGRGMGRVLGDLAARGYDAEWDCLPAEAVGADHQRDRVWIVAYPKCRGRRPFGIGGGMVGVRADGAYYAGEAQESGPSVADATSDGRVVRWAGDASQEPRGRESGRGCVGADAVGDSNSEGQLQPRRVFSDERGRIGNSGWWNVEPDVGRVAHGVPARVDRLRGLGNAIVPQIAEWIGRRLMEATA
jgi:DNA (cytosine-5)-methyltransferase 1